MMRDFLFSGYRGIAKILSGTGIGNLWPVNVLHKQIMRRRTRQPITLHGKTFYTDPEDSMGLAIHGIHEPFETEVIRSRVRRADVVFDIGANIGYYTILFATLVGPEGHVFAFEPEASNLQLLRKNVSVNGLTNVTIVPQAVSDHGGETELYISHGTSCMHSLYPSKFTGHSVKVGVLRLDDFVNQRSLRPSLIKLDVEGAEYRALLGLRNFLGTDCALQLVVEIWPEALERSGTSAAAVIELLLSHEFALFALDDDVKDLKRIAKPEFAFPARTNVLAVRGR